MPCSKCGRTAKREWLLFRFDREKKELFCPFCTKAKSFSVGEMRIRMLPFLFLFLLIPLCFGAISSFPHFESIDYKPSEAERLDAGEPGLINDLSLGEEVKLQGMVNSSQTTIADSEGNRLWNFKVRNFTLEQENSRIKVLVGNFTTGHQFGTNQSWPREYRHGDEVLVMGTVMKENGSLVVKASDVFDRDPDSGILKSITNMAYYLLLMNAISMFIPIVWLKRRTCTFNDSKENQEKMVVGKHRLVSPKTEESMRREGRVIKISQWNRYFPFVIPFTLLLPVILMSLDNSELSILEEPTVMNALTWFFVLVACVIPITQAPGERYFLREYVETDKAVLLYRSPREPQFWSWEELLEGKVQTPNFLHAELARRMKAKMEEEQQVYYQRLKEQETDSEPWEEPPGGGR